MTAPEIGFPEIRNLLAGSWKLILGLAVLAGLLATVLLMVLVHDQYRATAKLVVHPVQAVGDGGGRTVLFYRALLESDSIIQQVTGELIGDGVLEEGASLALGRELFSRVLTPGTAEDQSAVLAVSAVHEDPQSAAKIANAWAASFVRSSRAMLGGTSEESQSVLTHRLYPTREQLVETEAERTRILEKFQEREEKTSTSWDERISAATRRGEKAAADFHKETRRLMEASVAELLPAGLSTPGEIRSRLTGLISVRAQLSQTPRVLALEKAASDETLAEMIVEGHPVELFEGTLISEEIDPLYSQLTLSALELEGELESLARQVRVEIAPALARLEEIQFERAAELVTLLDKSGLDLRILRRRRSHALQALAREREAELAKLKREIGQLTDLEATLSKRLNLTVVVGLLETVDVVTLAAPAVASPEPIPRELALKIAVAAFLGGMLGLVVALFRLTAAGSSA